MTDLEAVELESLLIILAAPLLVVPWVLWCAFCAVQDWRSA